MLRPVCDGAVGIMRRTSFISALLAAALVLGGPALAAGKYYKWIDENGVTHYTLSPPPDGRQGEQVRTFNSASSDQSEALQKLEQQREAAAKAREQAATTPREPTESAEQKAAREERCKQHRDNLRTLKELPTVRRQDPATGEMTVVTDEERQKLIQETEKALEECK